MIRPGAAFLVIDQSALASSVLATLDPPALAAAVYVEIAGERGYFAMLSVDPAYQKQGLGDRLVSAVEERCQHAGCSRLDIEVVDLRHELPAFYSRFGFEPYGEASFPDPEKLKMPARLVLMTKRLETP
ncbi:MAG TPA: GNAT family N-acetyltransferase [Vicinamibacterales bacterium]|jgi:GNAT superfamily N-acetyltransferase|nr:GNAT family N-acetyltransferase [Vicinamibacterales bacterium]